MNDFAPLDAALKDLLARCSPAQSAAALKEIMAMLKAKNTQRMTANITPDGAAMAPRRPQMRLRHKKNSIRKRAKTGAMFRKMGKMTKVKTTSLVGELDFVGGAARIAEVHHFGMVDRVRAGLTAQYTSRPLLGIAPEDEEMVRDIVLRYLTI